MFYIVIRKRNNRYETCACNGKQKRAIFSSPTKAVAHQKAKMIWQSRREVGTTCYDPY